MSIDNTFKVFSETKDYPLATIRDMVAEGEIITNPDYQREFIYNKSQSSKLIESVLMGIPIPNIYLCQENDETLSVIDGQQRITSFVNFLENKFSLSGLPELKELNKLYFRDLSKDLQRKLKSATLHAICITKESQELKYEIFARLNQGAIQLKPQELRNCIYRGSFNEMLKELAEKNMYLPSLFYEDNKRMQYQEKILRFFALRDFANYKSSALKTMNAYMDLNRNVGEKEIKEFISLFNQTIDIIKQIIGDTAFCSFNQEDDEIIKKFSGPVYDSIIIPFSLFNRHDLMSHADEIRKAIDNLKRKNKEYYSYTHSGSTGDRKKVIGRILIVYNLLHEITGSYGNDDCKRLFSNKDKKDLFHPGYICSWCNNEILSIDDAEVDHIIPFSQGGKTDITNAQLLHRHCNREKYNTIDDENFDNDEE